MWGLIMKKFIISMTLCLPTLAMAQPSSQIAWTAEQINFVKAGNPAKGEQLAKSCAACHGEKGISATPGYPSLAGQLANYLFKQLQDYASGARQNPLMNGIAGGLSKQDAADLANWFAQQQGAFQSRSPMVYERAEKLVKGGSRDRVLPPCEVCHGTDGKGHVMDTPALSGQSAEYISAVLKAFKTGERHNDIYSRMRLIAESLTDAEIEELGFYYQNIKP